jgi:hypothetical protein
MCKQVSTFKCARYALSSICKGRSRVTLMVAFTLCTSREDPQITAVRRKGYAGLSPWRGGEEGYQPFIHSFASEIGFCPSSITE